MNVNILTRSTRRFLKVLNQNSPTILTGLSVAGVITTVVLAVKATPKAMQLLDDLAYAHYLSAGGDKSGRTFSQYLEDNHADTNAIHIPVLSAKEIAVETWKEYIPAVVMGSVTVACIIGANSINLRRNAALASLYSITDTALKEYQAKVVERIGKTKEENIRGDIAQDKLNGNPVDKAAVIITGKGDMLCFESLSGRYFKSDIETLRRIQNDFNKRLLNEIDLPINELYYEMGLASIKIGDSIGWSAMNRMLEMKFSAKIATDGQPCIVVEYEQLPTQIKP